MTLSQVLLWMFPGVALAQMLQLILCLPCFLLEPLHLFHQEVHPVPLALWNRELALLTWVLLWKLSVSQLKKWYLRFNRSDFFFLSFLRMVKFIWNILQNQIKKVRRWGRKQLQPNWPISLHLWYDVTTFPRTGICRTPKHGWPYKILSFRPLASWAKHLYIRAFCIKTKCAKELHKLCILHKSFALLFCLSLLVLPNHMKPSKVERHQPPDEILKTTVQFSQYFIQRHFSLIPGLLFSACLFFSSLYSCYVMLCLQHKYFPTAVFLSTRTATSKWSKRTMLV